MIEFLPFRVGHLTYLKPQAAQRHDHAAMLREPHAAELERFVSLSAWAGHVCVGAAGVIPIRPHRAVAWLLLSDTAGDFMVPLVRKVRRTLALLPYKRIELTVAADFQQGHQFARLLGARCETPEPMKFYGADGGDEVMYAVLKRE